MAAVLLDRLLEWDGSPVFAVLDGALFSDLPAMLRDAGFEARSLFLDRSEPEVRTDSPRMMLVSSTRLAALLALPGVVGGSVFWKAPGVDEAAMFRHLRGVTLVRIPAGPEAGARTVVFRHFDPGTMAITLPLLSDAQRSRLFGPARALALCSEGRALVAPHRSDWPAPERGMLSLDRTQMRTLREAMERRSERAIMRYLRDVAPDRVRDRDEAALGGFVRWSVAEARGWGLRTEAGFGRFAWLCLMSDGCFARTAEARSYVAGDDGGADRRLHRLMGAAARAAEAGA